MFCQLLKEQFSTVFSFRIPKGGMAVWITLSKKYSWKSVSEIARNHQLEIGEWQRYDSAKSGHSPIRIGFETHNHEETYDLIARFSKLMKEVESQEKYL